MAWDESDLVGPEGEDWRVPVSELELRQTSLAEALNQSGISGALIQNPVDLYYFAGGRQNSSLYIPAADGGGDGPVQFVRRSVRRAQWEAGGDDAPHEVLEFPRLGQLGYILQQRGAKDAPALQNGMIPHAFIERFRAALSDLGDCGDVTTIVHQLRETKSPWELEQMSLAAEIQLMMFDAVAEVGKEGVTELELVAAAESVSRAAGYGGDGQLRRFPMQCDLGVIVAGRAGGIPSFFDSAVGGTGAHPMAPLGAGFTRVKNGEPVLVDLLHIHRGYTVDMTRMFVAGSFSKVWEERLEDMLAVKDVVVDVLHQGRNCSEAWFEGQSLAIELGYKDNLMGIQPDQTALLGHSVGLELDESPVVAAAFERPLPEGGTMAIEPKVVYPEGSIGSEDTWVRTEGGMQPITAGAAFPWVTEW